MPIYHCSIQIIGRSSGRSAVAAAAYRAAEKLEDKETGLTHDYTKKQGVVHREIMLPEYAPEEYKNREVLWNEVQKAEKRSDAQLAREIEVALPRELSFQNQITVVQVYIRVNFVEKGMCADWVLHDKGDGNPHAHIMLTTRPIKKNGQWGQKQKSVYKLDEQGNKIPVIDPKTGKQKVRIRKGKGEEKLWERTTIPANDWNNPGKAEEWRKAWADCLNAVLPAEKQVDHRSYVRQGIDQEPTIHEGYAARKMEKQGRTADRCQMNREIRSRNALLRRLQMKLKEIVAELAEIVKKGEAFYEQRVKRLFIHRTERIGGVYGDAGSGQREIEYRKREAERGERAAEQRKWYAAAGSSELEKEVGNNERIYVATESAKKPHKTDFEDESIENIIEKMKTEIEALQDAEKELRSMRESIEAMNPAMEEVTKKQRKKTSKGPKL